MRKKAVMIKSYKDLEIYQKAQKLYTLVIQLTNCFPRESFYLKDQLSRAANSVGANIAEGFGRSPAEFRNYLTKSLGSCNEIGSHLEDCAGSHYGDVLLARALIKEYDVLGKRIYSLRKVWMRF